MKGKILITNGFNSRVSEKGKYVLSCILLLGKIENGDNIILNDEILFKISNIQEVILDGSFLYSFYITPTSNYKIHELYGKKLIVKSPAPASL